MNNLSNPDELLASNLTIIKQKFVIWNKEIFCHIDRNIEFSFNNLEITSKNFEANPSTSNRHMEA